MKLLKLFLLPMILIGTFTISGCKKDGGNASNDLEQQGGIDQDLKSTEKEKKSVWGGDGKSVALKAKWIVGKSYVFRQKTDMKMALPIAGADGSETKTTMDLVMDVSKDPETDNKFVSVKFEKVKVEMKMAGQEMVYDSEDKDKQSPLLKTAFAGFSEQTFQVQYDKNDRLLEVKGEEPAAGNLLGGQGIGKEEIRNALKQLTEYGFPEQSVEPDAQWQHKQEFSMQQMGKMNMAMIYTYKGPADYEGKKVAEIVFKGRAETDGKGGLVSFKDSKMSGTMYFDPELGIIIHSESDMNLTMSVGGEAGAEMDTETRSSRSLISLD